MSVLDDAFDLIEKGQLADARSLLTLNEPEFSTNPDYWWLLAHASADAVDGRNALNQVLVLDKNYPGAKELDSQVRAAETIQNIDEPRRQSRWFPVLLVVLLLFAVSIILFLVANSSGGGAATEVVVVPSEEATQSSNLVAATMTDIMIVPTTDAGQATIIFDVTPTESATAEIATADTTLEIVTELPTEIIEASPTSEEIPTLEESTTMVTDSPTEDSSIIEPTVEAQAVPVTYAFMQGQSTPENGVMVEGSTLKIQLCATPGIEAGNAIRDILLTISTGTAELDDSIKTIEIALVDCLNANEEQRVVAIERSFVSSFTAGSINLQQLQQEIRPIR